MGAMRDDSRDEVRERLDDLAFYRKDDAEANRMSSPPPSEQLRWASFWLVDFITPEVLPQTIQHLQASPLDRGDSLDLRDPVSEWIGQVRTLPVAGGFMNLTVCTHPPRRLRPSVTCNDLPDEIELVQASIHSLTPGLQALLACFYLTDSAQTLLQEALSKDRQTEAVELEGGVISYHSPSHQKATDLLLIQQAVRSSAAAWMGRNIPGVFTSCESSQYNIPGCDFVTARNRVPFARYAKKRHKGSAFVEDYMRIMRMEGDWDAWASDELPGFRLGLPGGFADDRQVLTLAARERDITHFAEKMYAGPLAHRSTHKLHHIIDDLLITWGLHRLAEHYHANLSEQRDSWNAQGLTTADAGGRAQQAAATLGKVADSRALARDLIAVTEPGHPFQRTPLRLKAVSSVFRERVGELHDGMTDMLRRKASSLDTLSSDLEALTVAGSNLDVASANLSLQKRMTRLTKWLVAFTIVLVVLTGVLIYQAYVSAS